MRCIIPPANTVIFEIAEERNWSILNQLAKGVTVIHNHILNSLTCESNFNLIVDDKGIQHCRVCPKNRFYNPNTKSCDRCSDSCEE
jgi:hypothetical protein